MPLTLCVRSSVSSGWNAVDREPPRSADLPFIKRPGPPIAFHLFLLISCSRFCVTKFYSQFKFPPPPNFSVRGHEMARNKKNEDVVGEFNVSLLSAHLHLSPMPHTSPTPGSPNKRPLDDCTAQNNINQANCPIQRKPCGPERMFLL